MTDARVEAAAAFQGARDFAINGGAFATVQNLHQHFYNSAAPVGPEASDAPSSGHDLTPLTDPAELSQSQTIAGGAAAIDKMPPKNRTFAEGTIRVGNVRAHWRIDMPVAGTLLWTSGVFFLI